MPRWFTKELYIAIIIVSSCLISFSLGRFSVNSTNHEEVRFCTEDQNKLFFQESSSASSSDISSVGEGTVVASKSGSKYHYPWCPGARTISEANKITFSSIQEARSQGYLPASNCKGLQ